MSPYGYGGPYWWGEGDRALAATAFWGLFDEWASRSDAVSEFVRFDLHPERLVPYPGIVEVKSANVVVLLDLLPEDLWMDTAHKLRKNVQRARRSGLEVIRDARGDRLEDFLGPTGEPWHREVPIPGSCSLGSGSSDLSMGCLSSSCSSTFSRQTLLYRRNWFSFQPTSCTPILAVPIIVVRDRPNDLLKYEIMLSARKKGSAPSCSVEASAPTTGSFISSSPSPLTVWCLTRLASAYSIPCAMGFCAGAHQRTATRTHQIHFTSHGTEDGRQAGISHESTHQERLARCSQPTVPSSSRR